MRRSFSHLHPGFASSVFYSPVIRQQHLTLCAALAVKAGMDPFEAMKAIAINPARYIGIEDRVGTIEAGKDADFVICAGSPLEPDHKIVKVLINREEIN